MKIDTYTKTILTIIASCLLVIAFRDTAIIPSAQAQTHQVGTPPLAVNIVEIGGTQINTPRSIALPVRIRN